MNAHSSAKHGYASNTTPTRTFRGTEYEAVARITHRLKAADALGSKGFASLAKALHDNKELWTIFAIDVSDKNNSLPADLKARLFYLAEFTLQHTTKVLARSENVAPLVDINTAILRGLRSEVQ